MPIIETKGAASSQGFGQFASTGEAVYIESVFQTWLYTGNNGDQTITNGIDLSTKGGLVWMKSRNDTQDHYWWDTNRGNNKYLASNLTAAQGTFNGIAFNTNGFTDKLAWSSSTTVASWTFRKQPKFFDVVTYTGDGTAGRTVAHSLGSVPGCIIVKQTSASGQGWAVYHRSEGQGRALLLNDTAASFLASGYWNSTAPTSTVFSLGSSATVNGNGATYVAYLFAHDAGGFGLTGTDNVISCGSFTTGGSYTVGEVNLGYEPQWAMIKRVDSTSNWSVADIMRGMPGGNNFTQKTLNPNLSDAEQDATVVSPNATGFSYNFLALNATYIYIAIRRGPMKTPTSGTSVFYPQQPFGQATITGGFVADTMWARRATSNSDNTAIANRLTGQTYMASSQNYAEGSDSTISFASNTATIWGNFAGGVRYNWARAPGFYDVVCYTGTNSSRAQAHNLSVAPEWIIAVSRDPGSNWQVFYSFGVSTFSRINLNTNAAASTGISYGTQLTSAPTASNINLGASFPNSIEPIVMYLFASLPGVSKVGSYTGTGAAQTINCGFTGGARFIMIKRADSTGDWYVYDSARGISSGNDSYFLMNSVAAFDTSTDYVDTASSGFQLTSSAPAALNANGGTYIFLAIA